jgi:hypothetical protein
VARAPVIFACMDIDPFLTIEMTGSAPFISWLLRLGRPRNWVLLEKSSPQSGIEICSHLNDLVSAEPANPTVSVVEPEAILGGRKRMQFNYRPVPTHQRMPT